MKRKLRRLMQRHWPKIRLALKIQLVGSVFSAICACCSGCATGYLADRARDGADIFTATLGAGLGGSVRAGPVCAGLVAQTDVAGLRGGRLFAGFPPEGDFYQVYATLIPLPWRPPDTPRQFGFESCATRPFVLDDCRSVYHTASTVPCIIMPTVGDDNMPVDARTRWKHLTQVEALLGLGPSLRLGFNPGELLDFILGWTTIDIFNDDLEWKKRKSNHTLERTSQ